MLAMDSRGRKVVSECSVSRTAPGFFVLGDRRGGKPRCSRTGRRHIYGTVKPSFPRAFRRRVKIKRCHIPRLEGSQRRPGPQVLAGLQVITSCDERTARDHQCHASVGVHEDSQGRIEDGDRDGGALHCAAVLAHRSSRQPIHSGPRVRPPLPRPPRRSIPIPGDRDLESGRVAFGPRKLLHWLVSQHQYATAPANVKRSRARLASRNHVFSIRAYRAGK